MRFLVPSGIGDSVWALTKVQAIRDAIDIGGPIDIILAGDPSRPIETRAIDFVRRFDFVDSVSVQRYDIHKRPEITADGRYNYLDDGMYDFDDHRVCVLIPNAALERGERLESWLPQYAIDWDIMDRFAITADERRYADDLASGLGPYCVFYTGPLHGNTINGHNRNALWRPADWIALGRRVHRELGLRIVVVGAPYDHSYFGTMIAPSLNGDGVAWVDLHGETNLGQLYSVTSRARFVVSYQAGVGIVSTLLGTPTALWWRPEGDSISPDTYLSFDERMASAWVPPMAFATRSHLPLIYGRETVDDIMAGIKERKW